MTKVQTFYRSKKWRRFIEALKVERADEDGNIICAHCGQAIVRKYDCIGHHIKELTEDNVDDALVSLNPENVELIHFRCHNELHDRWQGTGQHVYLVYGSPCSGKSSWVNEVAHGDDLILDVDRIWDAICNDGRYRKVAGKSKRPSRVKANVFGIRDCMIEMIKLRKGMWRNAYIIGGYPLKSDRDRLCDLLNADEVYIEATKEECLKRAETERPEDWKEYIERWFEDFTN